MTRGIAPGDIPRLLAQSGRAVSLDVEGDVLLRRSALGRALAGLIGTGPHVTLVLAPGAEDGPPGFIEARRRVGGTAADLIRVAPALSEDGAAATWQRLLSDACQRLGAHGARRVYAAVPGDNDAALQILLRSGFAAFGADVVYRRDQATTARAASCELDADADQAAARLVEAGRAARERMIEGPDNDWDAYPLGGHWPRRVATGLVTTPSGEARGCWRVIDGASGCWLRAEATDDGDARQAVAAALAAVGRGPVWSAARTHQASLHQALRHHGFQPVGERSLLVRHTTRNVMAPSWHEQVTGAIAPSPPVTPARTRPTGP